MDLLFIWNLTAPGQSGLPDINDGGDGDDGGGGDGGGEAGTGYSLLSVLTLS